MNTKFEGRVSS